MIDFSTLKGLTIPEGVVTQITDAQGNVLWKLENDKPIILEVEKITSDTYAGETTYTGEQFILLDIYPKTNGTVTVTYGGLTKTVTDTSGAEKPNAQEVFFGTFNGVSDSVETPASGELTISGAYYAYACGEFGSTSGKTTGSYCSCITNIIEFGEPELVPAYAFYQCEKIAAVSLPNGVISIGNSAFYGCVALKSFTFSEGLQTIGSYAFYNAFLSNSSTERFTLTLLEGLQTIGQYAFASNNAVLVAFEEVTLPSTIVSIGQIAFALTKPSPYQSNVRNLIVRATVPPTKDGTGSYGILGGVTNLAAIYVPKGCSDAYKAANDWKQYADYIVEAS